MRNGYSPGMDGEAYTTVTYQNTNITVRLDDNFFAYNYDIGTSGPYINYREVFARFELAPGTYVIVPATFEPNCHGKFMIRVYNSCSECNIKEL